MTALVPRGYGSFSTYQFNSSYPYTKKSYDGRYTTSGTTFEPPYPTQPIYQPTLQSNDSFPFFQFNPVPQPSIGAQFLQLMYQLDAEYRYEQYLRWVEKMRRQNAQLPVTSNIIQPTYDPYNMYSTFGIGGMGNLPNVRVIFVPPGQSLFQQSCAGPLGMPPFLYNRVSQPQCSFPLPPPLPPIGSMPLTPPVQQMVMQRYNNPVAVLPFNPNWQMPQPMMPSYPQVLQQQLMPPMPGCPSFPPALQSYIPPPPSFAPAAFHVPLPPSLQQPFLDPNACSSVPQYSNSGYPSMCRACPPAPPPLNIPVTGHCWVQHCCACHQVPTPISTPNDRPTGGRATPLLRHPTVPQYVPDQITQQKQRKDFHANAPVMMRPWLRKTPPLPPGAILISDEYIDKKDADVPFDYSGKRKIRHRGRTYSKHRSTGTRSSTVSTMSSINKTNTRSLSPNKTNKNNNNSVPYQGLHKSKSASSTSSSSSLSSGLSTEYTKTTFSSNKTSHNTTPSKLSGEAYDVNLQYKYQAQDVPTVDHRNRYLKSSSEASTLSPKHETLSDRSPSNIKERSRVSPSASELSSIKEEPIFEKEDKKPPCSPSQRDKPKKKIIIIREFVSSSPSTISTISSDMEFNIIDKDIDSLSTTSTLKDDTLDEDESSIRDIL